MLTHVVFFIWNKSTLKNEVKLWAHLDFNPKPGILQSNTLYLGIYRLSLSKTPNSNFTQHLLIIKLMIEQYVCVLCTNKKSKIILIPLCCQVQHFFFFSNNTLQIKHGKQWYSLNSIEVSPQGGGGYFHMYAYWVCAARETPIFSPEFPFRSISFSQITKKSVPEHHHFTFFGKFCRSGDLHFHAQNGSSSFRSHAFSRSKRLKLVFNFDSTGGKCKVGMSLNLPKGTQCSTLIISNKYIWPHITDTQIFLLA